MSWALEMKSQCTSYACCVVNVTFVTEWYVTLDLTEYRKNIYTQHIKRKIIEHRQQCADVYMWTDIMWISTILFLLLHCGSKKLVLCTRCSQSSSTTVPSNHALFLQMFQKIVQSSLLQSFHRKFFRQSLHSIIFELIQNFYWNMVLFAQTHLSVVCCRKLLPCRKTKLVPSFIKTHQLLTWRLETLWWSSELEINDIGSYSVQLFEDLRRVRVFSEPQCRYRPCCEKSRRSV